MNFKHVSIYYASLDKEWQAHLIGFHWTIFGPCIHNFLFCSELRALLNISVCLHFRQKHGPVPRSSCSPLVSFARCGWTQKYYCLNFKFYPSQLPKVVPGLLTIYLFFLFFFFGC